ncbi:MAG: hypothetical protein LBT98_02860 [Puniceicoccales bacterium]|nr:hypothetical protein [Puniceicoccales bacterium]
MNPLIDVLSAMALLGGIALLIVAFSVMPVLLFVAIPLIVISGILLFGLIVTRVVNYYESKHPDGFA